jgi:hypothetical protein
MKRIVALLLVLLLSLTAVLPVYAANGKVTYNGNAKKFIFAPGGIGLGNICYCNGAAAAFGADAQQIVGGNTVEGGAAHQKIKAAFANAFFVVGQKGLADTQFGGYFFLADAFFFS